MLPEPGRRRNLAGRYVRRILHSPTAAPGGAGAPALTVIVPTRGEASNVAPLVERVTAALDGRLEWELIFVDDSDDSTPDEIRHAARRAPVRLHHRPRGRRPAGLGGAVVDGFAAARGRVLAVMDADLQHPPEVLPDLVAPILAGDADLVAGTRYDPGGAATGLSGWWRVLASRSARRAVHTLVPPARRLSDPMGGLFALSPAVIEGVALRPCGFKILLEVAVRARPRRVVNVPYRFRPRHSGRSKATLAEGGRLATQLWRLWRSAPPSAPPPVPAAGGLPRRTEMAVTGAPASGGSDG